MLERRPLRADAAAEILGRIIDGSLRSGTRINESHLSAELGISRTPLREALFGLATRGALKIDPGRGFSVPHYTMREITELLDALAILLPAALRNAANWELKDQVEARNLLNRARMQRHEPATFCEHTYLLLVLIGRQSPNSILRDECKRFSQLMLRYLGEALSRGWDPGQTLADLDACLLALQGNDHDRAVELLAAGLRRLGDDLAARFPVALEAGA